MHNKNGVAHTGLLTNYWKDKARQPSFWKENPYHGVSTRANVLFKDEYMSLFINEDIAAQAKETFPEPLCLAIAVRHKYFTKEMSNVIKSISLPIKQVVLLGSGFDTRPIRKKKYPVRFFEIDNNEVLEHKINIYKEKGINPNATYIGIDYVKEDFIDHLKKSGLDLSAPTHFIWEGNTMYLTKDEVKAVLSKIGEAFTGGVTISFDYINYSDKTDISVPESKEMLEKLKEIDAPMVNTRHNNPKELAEKSGFVVTKDIQCSELTKHYGVGDDPYISQKDYYFCTLRK